MADHLTDPTQVRAKLRWIIDYCREQQEILGNAHTGVVFNLSSPKKWGRSDVARIWPGGPKGRILADQIPGPGVIAMFTVSDVIQAAEAALEKLIHD